MKIGFAILLDQYGHNLVRSTQLELHQRFGVHLARQSPHITVKTPFDVEVLPPYIDYLKEVAESWEPFVISIDGFDSFGEQVIFLNVSQNPVLKALHEHLLSGLKSKFDIDAHEYEGQNVRFHASITAADTEERFKQAMTYLKKSNPNFTFRATTLGVFYYLGSGNGWIINHKVELGGSKGLLSN